MSNSKMSMLKQGVIMALCAGSVQATTFWDEDFEGTAAAVALNWGGTPCGGTPAVSTDRAFSGTQSYKHVFVGTQWSNPPYNGLSPNQCFMDRQFSSSNEIYLRWYEYMNPGFKVDDIGTKAIRPSGDKASHWFVYMWGSRQLALSAQAVYEVPGFGSENLYQNETAFSIPDGQWVCYEAHLKYNTPGLADGIYEGWANGVRFAYYPNRQWKGTNLTDPTPSNETFKYIREYVQDGIGTLYRDRIAVGDSRIGCLGGTPPPPPPSDTLPPSAPTGLGAQAASSSQINLTWNASTDNVGVTGYKIFRAGTQIATTAGTSYSDAGLSASTAYSYTVAAYDAAGNASGQSSAASVTTQASAAPVGAVNNLSVASVGSNSATLSFTQADDGSGQPAKYDVRFLSPTMSWGAAASVSQGTCATPLTGSQVGATQTCTVLGLAPATDYQFQLVPFRGTMNVDAVFGSLSNVASGRTSSATPPPAAGAQIFADDFESGNLSLWEDGVNPLIHNVINDPTGGGHGKVLEMKFLLSRAGDGGWLTRFFMPGYNEAYVDFDVYFPNDWASFTKLMAFYGSRTDNQWSGMGQAGKCPTGSDFFTAMTVIDRYNGDPEPFRFYTYYPAMSREPDGVTCWGRYGPSATSMVRPTLGAWNRLRLYVKLNTLGQSDGLERLYLNGTMFSEWTGLSFGDTNVLKLNSIQITGSAATPKDQILYFDNIKVVQGSPGGAPPADVVPPAKPRNMRIQ